MSYENSHPVAQRRPPGEGAEKPSGLDRFAYCSEATDRAAAADQLQSIFSTSRRNNLRDQITGTLALSDGTFMQVVEGPAARLDDLWRRLHLDPRHHDLKLLDRRSVTGRLFTRWSMMAIPTETHSSDVHRLALACRGSAAEMASLFLKLSSQYRDDWLV